MTYSEKLSNPLWQKKRLQVLERCGWKCAACHNQEAQLQVHHRYYIGGREPWHYPDFTLIALCKDCHSNAKNDESVHVEWEMLLSVLFSDIEFPTECVPMAWAINEGSNRESLTYEETRGAIEMLFLYPDLLSAAVSRHTARAKGLAPTA